MSKDKELTNPDKMSNGIGCTESLNENSQVNKIVICNNCGDECEANSLETGYAGDYCDDCLNIIYELGQEDDHLEDDDLYTDYDDLCHNCLAHDQNPDNPEGVCDSCICICGKIIGFDTVDGLSGAFPYCDTKGCPMAKAMRRHIDSMLEDDYHY
jgi:hypothetical protein